jgi:phytoene synthase
MAAARDLTSAYAHAATLLREGDPDRFFAALFAPADKRPHLHALYAFSLEIARIRDSVSEALPGEIRLQWWRDALQGEARGDVMANPVAAALDDTVVRFRLPRQALVNLVDARVGDLYDDPIPTLNDLEGYCGETSSTLIRLASLILASGGDAGSPDAAGHAGVAYAVAGLLRAFPYDVRRGRLTLPQSVLDQHGVARDELHAGRRSLALDRALGEMRGVARRHLDSARRFRATLPAPVKPAFLPVALVDGYLRQMKRRDYDPFRTVIDRPLWLKQWVLWRAARSGRF